MANRVAASDKLCEKLCNLVLTFVFDRNKVITDGANGTETAPTGAQQHRRAIMPNFETTDEHGESTVFHRWIDLYRFIEQRADVGEWGDPYAQFGDFEIAFGMDGCGLLDTVFIFAGDVELANLWALGVVGEMEDQYWQPYGITDRSHNGWTVDTSDGLKTSVTSPTETDGELLWKAIQLVLGGAAC